MRHRLVLSHLSFALRTLMVATCFVHGLSACTQNLTQTSVAMYAVGGTVQGLLADSNVVIALDTQNVIVTAAHPDFVFGDALESGASYAITIAQQPTGQQCQVQNDTGTIGQANVSNVVVACTPVPYALDASVAGLVTGDVLQLSANGGNAIAITGGGSGNDAATLSAAVAYGSVYSISIVAQPNTTTCSIAAPSGTVVGPTSIAVVCAVVVHPTYALGANVVGLPNSAALGLTFNGNAVSVTGNSAGFNALSFSDTVLPGFAYHLVVASSPPNAVCVADANASGVMPNHPLTIGVTCTPRSQILVTVTGLVPHGVPVTLSNTYGNPALVDTLHLTDANNTQAAAFPLRQTQGTSYAVMTTSAGGYHCVPSGITSGNMPGSSVSLTLACTFSLTFATGQTADVALGQADMTSGSVNRGQSGADANTMDQPDGNPYAAPDGTFYVPDSSNRRVLGYHGLPAVTGQAADFVLGQPDFATTGGGTTATGYSYTHGITGQGNMLWVGDGARVLVYNQLPQGPVAADWVLGQQNFVTNIPNPNENNDPCDPNQFQNLGSGPIFLGNHNILVVADDVDNRVFVYNDWTASLQPNTVIGQDAQNSCFYGSGGHTDQHNLTHPNAAIVDGNRLFVADTSQNRILVFDDVTALHNGIPADHVMGQVDFLSGGTGSTATMFNAPCALLIANGKLFVADTYNNRVLVWNSVPSGSSAVYSNPPDVVLGQPDATSTQCNQSGGPTAGTLCVPTGLALVGTSLVVSDHSNSRVLIYHSL